MASMYDEYERAVEGNEAKKARSPWAMILGAMLGLFILGGVAFVGVAAFALHKAQGVVVDVMADLDHEGLVIELNDPNHNGPVVVQLENLQELRNLKHEIRHKVRHELRDVDRAEIREAMRSARSIRTVEVSRITEEALRAAEEGLREAEHALQEMEGELNFTVNGETMKMELFGDEDGGVFAIDIGEKSYSVRIEGEDDGARLHLNTPEGESVFLAGAAAQDVPAWVPRYPGSSHPDGVFSGELKGKTGGAGLSSTDDSPLDVVGHFTEALSDQGFDVSVERLSLGHSDVQGSIVGTRESDGRTVAVVVMEEAGETKVLTFWGES